MPEPEIHFPAIPVGPILTAAVAAGGTTLLFPTAAAVVGMAPVAGFTAGALVLPALIGGVAGWYAGKAMFNSTTGASELRHIDDHHGVAPSAFPPSSVEQAAAPQKEWQKSEELHRGDQGPRVR